MGGKHSSKMISEWGSQHVHHQESRRPRRGKEPSAGSSVTMSSFDTLSNASILGSSSSYKFDSYDDQLSRFNASSTENMSSFESLPSSSTNLLGSKSNASSSMTTADWFSSTIPSSRAITNTLFDSRSSRSYSRTTPDWVSHSAAPSSRTAANTFGSGSSGSSSRTSPPWLSGSAIPSSKTNTFHLRSNASNSTVTADLLPNWVFQHVGSTSNPSSLAEAFSFKASLAHDGVEANQPFKPSEWFKMLNNPTNSLDNHNIKLELQKQWPPMYFSPPSPVVLKINCAAAFEASSRQAGFGAVIRTQQGIFLAGVSGKLASCNQATVAEINAIKEGLRLAAWMNLQEVEIMSDSLVVISELQRLSYSWIGYPYTQLLNEAKGMAATFRNCKLLHVKQEANCVAHWLAMYGLFLENMQYWFYTAPGFLLHPLQMDVYSGFTSGTN